MIEQSYDTRIKAVPVAEYRSMTSWRESNRYKEIVREEAKKKSGEKKIK
jgi:hypothetical protein